MPDLRSLDSADRAILELVQIDNQLTHAQIGERVHLSASSVRRRLKALRASGVIQADVALVDPGPSTIQVIVMVAFREESVEAYRRFRKRMATAPEVLQVYFVSGELDFVLVVHAPDLASYQEWGERMLMSDDAIRRYDSHIVWRRDKFTTAVNLPESS